MSIVESRSFVQLIFLCHTTTPLSKTNNAVLPGDSYVIQSYRSTKQTLKLASRDMPNYFVNDRKMYMPNLYSFSPPIIRLWQNVLQGLMLDEKITLIYLMLQYSLHSIIMIMLVLSFTCQAETDCLYKEGQFLIFFLPNSLLPSFSLRRI